MPFVLEILLSKYGYQTTLRGVAVALTVLSGPVIPFFKPRLRRDQQPFSPKTELAYTKKPLFWVFAVVNILQGFGYFFPQIFLPSFATALGYSSTIGAVLLAVLFLAQVLGQIVNGWLSDGRVDVKILILVSTAISGISIFALWGPAHSLALLVVFAALHGFASGAYGASWARMGMALTDQPAAAVTVYAALCFTRGIGNVLTGPISARLIRADVDISAYGIGRYRNVVLFAGAAILSSSLCMAAWLLYVGKPRVRLHTKPQ